MAENMSHRNEPPAEPGSTPPGARLTLTDAGRAAARAAALLALGDGPGLAGEGPERVSARLN